MDIFAHKDLAAFQAWLSGAPTNGAYLSSVGLDAGAAAETMRLLTLCSLAGRDRTLSYDAIAAALQVRARAPAPPPPPLAPPVTPPVDIFADDDLVRIPR